MSAAHLQCADLDDMCLAGYTLIMTARELRKILKAHGCVELRQKGSHLFVQCGKCTTVVVVKKGEDLRTGTLRAIERQLEPCLGKGWLIRAR